MREYTSTGWKTETETHHYGVTLQNDKATTGVLSNNEIVQFLGDECCGPDSIDIGWEEALTDFQVEHGREPDDEEMDGWESDGPHLIGDWRKDADGLWEPHDGPIGYSVLVRETVTQVVRSKTTTRCAGCSPCYPGQGDIGSDGTMLVYTLPADCFDVFLDG